MFMVLVRLLTHRSTGRTRDASQTVVSVRLWSHISRGQDEKKNVYLPVSLHVSDRASTSNSSPIQRRGYQVGEVITGGHPSGAGGTGPQLRISWTVEALTQGESYSKMCVSEQCYNSYV